MSYHAREREPIEDHDRGLAFDLPRLVTRRTAVGLLAGGVGSVLLATCGGSDGGNTTGASGTATTTTSSTTEIPEETGGPFPGDGSNGPNVLTQSGVVREDITRSFGDASGVAEGVPTTVELTLLDVSAGGSPLATRGSGKLRTSQLAIPKQICQTVYATKGYEQSVQNLAQTSLETDNVFSDGYKSQLATAIGSVRNGITLRLNVGV